MLGAKLNFCFPHDWQLLESEVPGTGLQPRGCKFVEGNPAKIESEPKRSGLSKGQFSKLQNILANSISDKGLVSIIYKECS